MNDMQLTGYKEKWLEWRVLTLFFVANAALSYCNIYFNSLFLLSYSAKWLIYLILASTFFNICLSKLLKNHIASGNYLKQVILLLLLTFLCIPFLIFLKLPGIIFIFCLYLSFLKSLFQVICYGTASAKFDIRQYKNRAHKFAFSTSLGCILAGYSALFITKQFSLTALLVLMMILGSLEAFLIFRIKPTRPKQNQQEAAGLTQVLNYPLFQSIVGWILFIELTSTCSEYLMKYQISQMNSSSEIAGLFGLIFGSINLLSFLIQTFFIKRLLAVYGQKILSYSVILSIFIGGIIFLSYPSLITAILFDGLLRITEYSFNDVLNNIRFNALPIHIRNLGKLAERISIAPLGKSLASLTILFCTLSVIPELISQRLLGFICILSCIGGWYLHWLIEKRYQETLYDSIKRKRFTLEATQESLLNKKQLQAVAIKALEHPDPEINLLALNMLSVYKEPGLMSILAEKLTSSYLPLRQAVIQLIEKYQLVELAPVLEQRLTTETDFPTQWALLTALYHLAPNQLNAWIEPWLTSQNEQQKLQALYLIFKVGSPEQISHGLPLLLASLNHPDAIIRTYSLKLWSELNLGDENKILKASLTDPNAQVVQAALEACLKLNGHSLIPDIVNCLSHKPINYYAIKILIAFGEAALPALEAGLSLNKITLFNPIAQVVASCESPLAEPILLKYGQASHVLLKIAIAKHVFFQASQLKRSQDFYQTAYQLIMSMHAEIQSLNAIDRHVLHPAVAIEIDIRKHLTKVCLLYWFASYTDPTIAKSAVLILKNVEKHPHYNHAIELLDNLATDKQLKNCVRLFDVDEANPITSNTALQTDPMLKALYDYTTQPKEAAMNDILQKVVILREVSLFKKLPTEVLYIMAEETQWRDMAKGEHIFKAGDEPDGLYIIAAGKINIYHNENLLSALSTHDFFGEIGLFDNQQRLASAIAQEDGALLYIDKVTFDNLVNDVPDVLRAVASQVIYYLQKNLS